MPEIFRFPYTFEERRPMFEHPVLFVPEFYQKEQQDEIHQKFHDKTWQEYMCHPKIFIEFCAGNGQWIIDKAQKNPDILWIACERRFDRVKLIYKWIKRLNLKNCLVAMGDAETFCKYHLKSNSVQEIYVNFPDPWPKKKHAKNRLFKAPFLKDVKNCLTPAGKLTLVTDDEPFLNESIEEILSSGFKPIFDAPFYQTLDKSYGASFFETLWAEKGKVNRITQFIKPV